MHKRGSSFGTTIAVLGSTLIAVGIAWIIAQNWHQLSSAVKIIILLAATALAYAAGVIVREREYVGIGKGLIVLGGLLYTLSIFLIAQIFSTSVSLQGTALLLLLSWIGVLIASYVFDTAASMVIALAEFLVWMNVQFFAFYEGLFDMPLFGLLALLFLSCAALFYGLSLWHRAKEHEFSGLFQWCTAFYLLAFAYLLSFQTLLPSLWPRDADAPGSAIIFTVVIGLLSILTLLSGASASSRNVDRKEIGWFCVAFVLLAVLIGSASVVSQSIGTCSPKACYDYRLQADCEKAPVELDCVWKPNYCGEQDCITLGDQMSCEREGCTWIEGEGYNRCERPYCGIYRDQAACENANISRGCTWSTGNGEPFFGNVPMRYCMDKDSCVALATKETCASNNLCSWKAYSSFGMFGTKTSTPLSLWAIWIFANLVLLVVILGVIFYGTWQRLPRIVNIGIAVFSLDIITRYIGFIMDLRGYMSLSLIFITGGIILLLGGWLVERWRRTLVRQAKGQRIQD